MTTRKILLTISVFLCLITQGISQDVIIKRNGTEIQTKIIQITNDLIKYKDYSFLDGPLRSLYISEVFMVVYENGQRERFENNVEPVEQSVKEYYVQQPKSTSSSYKSQSSELMDDIPSNDLRKRIAIGTGYGNSYGGAGMEMKFFLGARSNLGFHIGGGIYTDVLSPDANIVLAYATGIQYYLWKGFYLDAEYGGIGTYVKNDNEIGLMQGPSSLFGVDIKLFGGFNINLAAGACYNINGNVNKFWPAYDLGFVYNF